jgi:phosphatidylethanolamine/phosphatidyl-N-methylethanolamine N-methyltransferase
VTERREEAGRRFWERNAGRYDRSMAIFGGPVPRMAALVADAVRGSSRALELASGTGLVTEAIAPEVGTLLATDYAESMVQATRARVGHLANVRCEARNVYALGEEVGSFDAVIAANVLHLLPDLAGGLAAMRAVLSPYGKLVVPTYCHGQNLRARVVSGTLSVLSFPVARRFDLGGLIAAVVEARFVVEWAELLPGLLPIGFVLATPRPDAR